MDTPNLYNYLTDWFILNKRVMPWRSSSSPYYIWLSEIILQQTRVEQGTPYFLKFIEAYPTIKDLASAPIDDVLKLWQGLGYYSRARNLHFAAYQIENEFNGQFPDKFEDILTLKGVGIYTASAIASIGYGLPYAVLDGNVYRVLSRLFNDSTPINLPQSQKHYQVLADSILNKTNPGMHNEAMMELGATICLPKNPKCEECPIQIYCKAYKEGLQNELPLKLKKAEKRNRYFHYLLVKPDVKSILIQKREGLGIWEGLYQIPLIETDAENINFQIKHLQDINKIKSVVHILTHQRLHITFYEVPFTRQDDVFWKDFTPLAIDEVRRLSFPKPIWDFLIEYVLK